MQISGGGLRRTILSLLFIDGDFSTSDFVNVVSYFLGSEYLKMGTAYKNSQVWGTSANRLHKQYPQSSVVCYIVIG